MSKVFFFERTSLSAFAYLSLSKGHPLGATGLGMAFYLVNQLRGRSGLMQVPELKPGGEFDKNGKGSYALLHNLGLGR